MSAIHTYKRHRIFQLSSCGASAVGNASRRFARSRRRQRRTRMFRNCWSRRAGRTGSEAGGRRRQRHFEYRAVAMRWPGTHLRNRPRDVPYTYIMTLRSVWSAATQHLSCSSLTRVISNSITFERCWLFVLFMTAATRRFSEGTIML